MNSINYVLFEVIKYRIEFLDCLEYSLLNDNLQEKEIIEKLNYLNNELNNGTYNSIISSLFTSYATINDNLYTFLKTYTHKKITKMNKTKKLKNYVAYVEQLVNCEQTFVSIIKAFLEEKEIKKSLDKKLENLRKTSESYFSNFLFFTTYNLYINSENKNLKASHNDFSRLIALLNYCNKDKKFQEPINILQINNKDKVYEELKKLSANCIKLEEKQQKLLKNWINELQNEAESNKISA